MRRSQRATTLGSVVLLAASMAAAQGRQEFHYVVKPHAKISIANQFGPVSVVAGDSNRIDVVVFVHSDKVEVTQSQSGSRVELTSHLMNGADARSGQVDYDVRVPADASVVMRSATGQMVAAGLRGDISVAGAAADVDIHNVNDAHVHVKTMEGTVKLTAVHGGHVEITSVSGPVMLQAVDGPIVQVNSGSGTISYDGDFSGDGNYSLHSHNGNIDVLAPADSTELLACTVTGHVVGEFHFRPVRWPCATLQTAQTVPPTAEILQPSSSSVHLFTFSGRINLKKK